MLRKSSVPNMLFLVLTFAGQKEEAGSPVDSKQEVFGVWWFGLCLYTCLCPSILFFLLQVGLSLSSCISHSLPILHCICLSKCGSQHYYHRKKSCAALHHINKWWLQRLCLDVFVIFKHPSKHLTDSDWYNGDKVQLKLSVYNMTSKKKL